jgi:hypothetical protein
MFCKTVQASKKNWGLLGNVVSGRPNRSYLSCERFNAYHYHLLLRCISLSSAMPHQKQLFIPSLREVERGVTSS